MKNSHKCEVRASNVEITLWKTPVMSGLSGVSETRICGGGGEEGGLPVIGGSDPENQMKTIGKSCETLVNQYLHSFAKIFSSAKNKQLFKLSLNDKNTRKLRKTLRKKCLCSAVFR